MHRCVVNSTLQNTLFFIIMDVLIRNVNCEITEISVRKWLEIITFQPDVVAHNVMSVTWEAEVGGI